MATTNKTKFAILGLLQYGKFSGYDIKKFSDESIGFFWQENYGHIYPVLKQLLAQGLVTCEQDNSNAGPKRNLYSITEKGTDLFTKWMAEAAEPEKYRKEILLKIFFAHKTDPQLALMQLQKEKQHHVALLREYKLIRKHLKSLENVPEYSPFWQFTVQNGIMTSETQINWCDNCIEEINKFK